MNCDRIDGSWKAFKGKVREFLGKVRGDRREVIEGKWDRHVGKMQETQGIATEATERDQSEWDQRQRAIDRGGSVHP